MKKNTLLKTGMVGAVLASLCCFTPLLVMLLGAIGLSAWVPHLDMVLMPALLFFVVLMVYAWIKKDKQACCQGNQDEHE